jgi:hypothetical protein
MAFNINDIISNVNAKNGLHRSAHFNVYITPPPAIASHKYGRDSTFFCEEAVLPGMHIDTTQVRPLGYGVQEHRPNDYNTQHITLKFLLDNQGDVYDFFYKWMGNIMNFGIDIHKATPSSLNYYESAYPKEYESVINIIAYDTKINIVHYVDLNQAFPINIGDVSVAWEMNDQISRVPVTFAYKTWSNKKLPFTADERPVGINYRSQRNSLPAELAQNENIPSFVNDQIKAAAAAAKGAVNDAANRLGFGSPFNRQ